MKTLCGSCHCGAVELKLDIDESPLDVTRCDCSLCRRKGAIMAGVPIERLRVVHGQDMLTLYQWNTMVAKHWFCSRCGVYTHHQRRSNPGEYGVNVGCFDDIDPASFGDVPVADGSRSSVVE